MADAETPDDSLASPFRERPEILDDEAVGLLTSGALEVLGQFPWSSNGAVLVDVLPPEDNAPILQGVYKPMMRERPLWDFPAGLHKREVAAFRMSHFLGWNLVPPTVLRHEPLGEGSVQLYVPTDYDQHYFTLREEPVHHDYLKRLCAFDFLINSTDRKGGHVLIGRNGQLHAVDNGLSFHYEFKLRTVIWEWAGEVLPADIGDDLQRLVDNGLPAEVASLLDPFERDAVMVRANVLVDKGRFPIDPSGRRYPWPLV